MKEDHQGFDDIDFAEEDLGEDSYAPAPPPPPGLEKRSVGSTPAEMQRERERERRGRGEDPVGPSLPEAMEAAPTAEPEEDEPETEPAVPSAGRRQPRGGGRGRGPKAPTSGVSVLTPVILVAALATFVLSIIFTRFGGIRWGNFLFFLVLFVLASLFELKLKGGGTLSLGLAPLLAALVALPVAFPSITFVKISGAGAVQVVWIYFIGMLAVIGLRILLKSENASTSRAYLMSVLLQYAGVGLASLAYLFLIKILPKKPVLHGGYTPVVLIAVAIAAGILYLVYVASESMIMSAEGNFPMGVYLQSILRKSWVPFGIVSFTGVLIGIIYANLGKDIGGLIWALIIVLPLLLIFMYAYNRVAATDQYLLETIKVLSAIPEETGMLVRGHAERVAELATGVARELGLGPEDTQQVEFAAYLHDIGAITKQGQALEQRQLSETEGVIAGGVDIVGKVDYLDVASEILGGREGLRDRVSDVEKRRAVSLGAGILRAVDDFESLVQGSDDREPLTESEALTEMNLERGVKYDSKVLRAIARVLARMPREITTSVEGSPESSPFWGDQEG